MESIKMCMCVCACFVQNIFQYCIYQPFRRALSISKTHFPGSWEDFYEDYDWSELPTQRSDNENVKAAAKDLGFTKTTWDTNLTVPTDYLDWANLTTSEQEAAMILGYDECTWDRETIDGAM